MDNSTSQLTDFLNDLINRLQTISLANFTMFDLIVVVIFIALLTRGVWIGFVRQLAAFVALIGGYLIAARYVGELRPFTTQFIDNPKIAFFAAFGIIFLVAAFVFTLAGHLLHKLVKVALLGWLDRFFGLLLGTVKAYLVCSFLFMVLAANDSPFQAMLKKSQTANFLTPGAELVRRIINDPKLREHFKFKQGKPGDGQVPGSPPDRGRHPGPRPQPPHNPRPGYH